jgi:hypothetical protein
MQQLTRRKGLGETGRAALKAEHGARGEELLQPRDGLNQGLRKTAFKELKEAK